MLPRCFSMNAGMLPVNLIGVWLLTTLAVFDPLQAQESGPEYYQQHVKPLLHERCFPCHGALRQEADLRLDTVAAMLDATSRDPVIIPGDADGSLLIQRLRHSDPDLRMPPEGRPLTDAEIQSIMHWILTGAQGLENETPQSDPADHWAFLPPQQIEISAANAALHPIDALLQVAQMENGVAPLPAAEAGILVRRLYLDLLGIPPTPQEVEVFLRDDSPQAYAALVDELLARPEYGERWGRHWMDVWRYSDWYGRRSVPDVMNSYPQIWRWRDWIVRSLNEDKGYDRMIQEMLAADEVTPADPNNTVATGFLVRNWYKWNYESWMKDNVEHTARAFLGVSLHCAHCHNHKYDPFTHEDYFHFRAFFEPLELRHDRVAGEVDPGPFKKYVYAESYGPISSGAIRVFDEKPDAPTRMYTGGDARNVIPGREALSPQPPAALCWEPFSTQAVELPVEAFYPGAQAFVRNEEIHRVEAALESAGIAVTQATQSLHNAEESLASLRAERVAGSEAAGSEATGSEAMGPDPTLAAEQACLIARLDLEIARASQQVERARLDSLHARIAADDARYRAIGDSDALARAAHRSEKQLAYQEAVRLHVQARKKVLQAQFQVAISTEPAAPSAEPAAASSEVSAAASAEASIATARETLTAAQQAVTVAMQQENTAVAALISNELDYTPLSPVYPGTSTGRRSALARWITDRRNPLSARVAVNHVWLRHLGQPLVETTDNFGLQGKSPEHQALLDWLAVDLMEHRWSLKHLHRRIVTSAAYRRSSQVPIDHPGREVDRDNRSYWCRKPLRMEAEVVRDSILASAGSLDLTLGGPEINPAQWHVSPRRSLYFTIHGEADMTFLNTFDGPNVSECYRRSTTVLPQQALAMTNGELVVHHGRLLARRVTEDVQARFVSQTAAQSGDGLGSGEGGQPQVDVQRLRETFVQEVFWRVLSRSPTPQELAISLEFLRTQADSFASVSADELAIAPATGVVAAATDAEQRARENLTISIFSHHDFVTIR